MAPRMAASVLPFFGNFHVFVCLFIHLLLPSGHIHQRDTSKHLTVLSLEPFSVFLTRTFYGDFGWRRSVSMGIAGDAYRDE